MKVCAVLFLLLTGCFSSGFSQNALVMLKFEDAEKAFNNGNYEETLKHLDEVEKQAGVTSKTLYLRVVAEDKLFDNGARLYDEENSFDQLQRIRENAKKYLNALSKQGIDDKYREVYRISENLQAFPKNRSEWVTGKQAYLKKIEEQKQQLEEAKKLAAQKLKEEEYNQLYSGQLSINQVKIHKVAQISAGQTANAATVYFIRPKEGTKDMAQSLLLNEVMIKKKMKPGEFVKFNFTPGLVKIGETTAKNRKKIKTGTAILMGGAIGLAAAAAAGKVVAKSEQPFFLRLEAGKTYYVTSVITKDKTILYSSIDEAKAKVYLSGLKEID